MSGKLKPRFTPGSIEVKNAPAVDQTRGGEYGGQRRPLWQWLDQSQQRNGAESRPGSVWKMTVRELRRNNVSTFFQPFVRGDSARTISGTGLGLAIVQRIVDNHNGMLELGTSERGGLSIRALAACAGNAGAGHDKRRVNKTGGEGVSRFAFYKILDRYSPASNHYSFGPAATSAAPAGVSVYLSKLSINSFASGFGFFPATVPEKRRCYADRESSCLRPAVRLGSPG